MMAKRSTTIAPVFIDGTALKIPTLSLLKANGHLTRGASHGLLDEALAQKIYGDMIYIRTLDERMVRAQRQGRVSFLSHLYRRRSLGGRNCRCV